MVLASCTLLLFIAASAAGDPPAPADAREPLEVLTLEQETAAGPARCFVAKVNLLHPAVDVVVTDGTGDPACEARPITTADWAAAQKTTLAVNANYFGKATGSCFDVLGLSMSNGTVTSPVRTHGGRADPAIVFKEDGHAAVGHFTESDLTGVTHAVAGIGASKAEPHDGSLLVLDGKNLGSSARVAAMQRHPRTALGVSADGATLFVVVVDGRQPGWSAGMTLPELAEFMVRLGADDALNLDGGGSSSFVYTPSDGTRNVQNRPSDGSFRPVANHLGIRLSAEVNGQGEGASPSATQDSRSK